MPKTGRYRKLLSKKLPKKGITVPIKKGLVPAFERRYLYDQAVRLGKRVRVLTVSKRAFQVIPRV